MSRVWFFFLEEEVAAWELEPLPRPSDALFLALADEEENSS